MQPISHLPSSKPVHPQNSRQQEDSTLSENLFTESRQPTADSQYAESR